MNPGHTHRLQTVIYALKTQRLQNNHITTNRLFGILQLQEGLLIKLQPDFSVFYRALKKHDTSRGL